MKYLLIPFFMLATISLNSILMALHHNEYSRQYELCKASVRESTKNDYTSEQVFSCTEHSTIMLRVLGTILFSEGSVLE